MFADVTALKSELTALEPDEFYARHLCGGVSNHFSEQRLKHFCDTFSRNFNVDLKPSDVSLVGSGKIGFALHDKFRNGEIVAPAFRPFGPNSDIDLNICNSDLFKKIWFELSNHACLQNFMPWRSGNLSDYLIYGWLRPDKFPKGVALTHCDLFYETIGEIRRDRTRGHPKISVALFYSWEQIRTYQTKGLRASRARLEAT